MTTIPAAKFLVDGITYLEIQEARPHDEAIVLHDPATGNLIGLPPTTARMLIADLIRRVDLIDPRPRLSRGVAS